MNSSKPTGDGRVVALGLDSTDMELLNRFISSGHLPNIKRLKNTGSSTRLVTSCDYVDGRESFSGTEGNWVMFQTGVQPGTTGFWETVRYCPETYKTTNDFTHGGYDYDEYRPFYDLGKRVKSGLFDIPVSRVLPDHHGQQIVGWGGHFPYVVRGSSPKSLLKDTNRKHGKNAILYKDHGVFWSRRYRNWLEQKTIKAIEQRENILSDMLADKSLQLVMGVFGETHSVLHDLWAESDSTHPAFRDSNSHDPLENVFTRIDSAIGNLQKKLRPEDHLVLFSVHGMQQNSTDVPCLFFLSELMYRFNFPGKFGFARGEYGEKVPPLVQNGLHWYWFGEIWRQRHRSKPLLNRVMHQLPAWLNWKKPGGDFVFPFFTPLKGAINGWMPATWYRPSWCRSRSFAIPAFADGHVRINLKGREGDGKVTRFEYEKECQDVTDFLYRLINPRTGNRVVRNVIRTRTSAMDDGPHLPAADLIVVWSEEPFDVIDSPDVGRIGPVPFFRTGGHRAGGFAMLNGPAFQAATNLPDAGVVDMAPTILNLLNQDIPAHYEGKIIGADPQFISHAG